VLAQEKVLKEERTSLILKQERYVGLLQAAKHRLTAVQQDLSNTSSSIQKTNEDIHWHNFGGLFF
jgi:hypothetical protein